MNQDTLNNFEAISFPEFNGLAFSEEVSDFEQWRMSDITLNLTQAKLPETAKNSLERHFTVCNSGISVLTRVNPSMKPEEFILERTEDLIVITAADDSGFRYAACELEDRIRNNEYGTFHQVPAVPRRITRCFFAPNTRPPMKLNELLDDYDYYPDAYLDRIMHDRLNGVWLTMYLNDMPCSFFPERGKEAPALLNKLQNVVNKCARYGIKVYLYMAEPRIFRDHAWKSGTAGEFARHPELGGHRNPDGSVNFCTSSPAGQQYFRETLGHIFSTVHGLGGVINIMCMESAMPCAIWNLYEHIQKCNCLLCGNRSAQELFCEIASIMSDTIRKYEPDAAFFGWFYESLHTENGPEHKIRKEIVKAWPENAHVMLNIETGGHNVQLGKDHIVQDYSLSYAGPSEYFMDFASERPSFAAKIQTGCSHENASVPYLPVPGILYERYKNLRKINCSAVMQCWYFGCAPGMMNRAAGRLSFDPFPETEEEFLLELARPLWGEMAQTAAMAWKKLGNGYRYFPENLLFKWFGPLHNSIVTPWYLYPADLPIAPSYTQAFPKNSGDRFGEYFGYEHTLDEICQLNKLMEASAQESAVLIAKAAKTEKQKLEARLNEAIAIQTSSTRRLFDFYKAREEMICFRKDHKAWMHQLLAEEIKDTLRMAELCEQDFRLGYHAEVESYLFFPEKLRARALLLQECDAEIDSFDYDADILKAYRGETGEFFPLQPESAAEPFDLNGTSVKMYSADNRIVMEFSEFSAPVHVEFEPGRMMKIIEIVLTADRNNFIGSKVSGVKITHTNGTAKLEFDSDYFKTWRIDDTAPYRFNLICGDHALKPRKQWPSRLLLGTASSDELLMLKRVSVRKDRPGLF